MYPPPIFLTPIDPEIDYTDEEHEEDSAWVWSRFCAAVWDSLGKGAARDLNSFRAVCYKLWRPFVQPIVDGTFGTRDFPKLLVNRRPLLRAEEALHDGIVSKSTTVVDESRPKGRSLINDQKKCYNVDISKGSTISHTTPNMSSALPISHPSIHPAKTKSSS